MQVASARDLDRSAVRGVPPRENRYDFRLLNDLPKSNRRRGGRKRSRPSAGCIATSRRRDLGRGCIGAARARERPFCADSQSERHEVGVDHLQPGRQNFGRLRRGTRTEERHDDDRTDARARPLAPGFTSTKALGPRLGGREADVRASRARRIPARPREGPRTSPHLFKSRPMSSRQEFHARRSCAGGGIRSRASCRRP